MFVSYFTKYRGTKWTAGAATSYADVPGMFPAILAPGFIGNPKVPAKRVGGTKSGCAPSDGNSYVVRRNVFL